MPKKPPPSLPLSIFSPITPGYRPSTRHSIRRTTPLVVIDTHVFLPLGVQEDSRANVKLWQQSVEGLCVRLVEQQSPAFATTPGGSKSGNGLQGFIHIHQQPSWLLKTDTPTSQDGQSSQGQTSLEQWERELEHILGLDDIHLNFGVCPPLAQVIWAPLNKGPHVLGPFLDKVANTSKRVAGCCHLIERPSTTRSISLTDPDFVASLRLLGERGLGIELNVDNNHDRSAPVILEEVLECISAVRNGQDSQKETKFVLCQMGKPEMISSQSAVPSSASYSSILSRLFSLSLFSNLHIKLSGLPLIIDEDLSKKACEHFIRYKRPYQGSSLENVTLEALNEAEETVDGEAEGTGRAQGDLAWREVKKRIKFYLEPILEAFGDHRIMYSSGYPSFGVSDICTGASTQTGHYDYQFEMFKECLTELGLENESLDDIFGLNAQRWYGV